MTTAPVVSERWIGTSWKMTKTLAEAGAFVDTLLAAGPPPGGIQPFFLPPLTALATVREQLGPDSGYLLGAQNADWADEGPRTGEVSMRMVADAGAHLVEIGHSERREAFGETDAIVARKVTAALAAGLRPLVCVGESAEVRRRAEQRDHLVAQTRAALAGVAPASLPNVLVAYEPIWAIGAAGRPARPDEIADEMAAIREVLDAAGDRDHPAPLLYGGSVNRDNAPELLDTPGLDGLFIGRAAWAAADFLDLISTAHRQVFAQHR